MATDPTAYEQLITYGAELWKNGEKSQKG